MIIKKDFKNELILLQKEFLSIKNLTLEQSKKYFKLKKLYTNKIRAGQAYNKLLKGKIK